MSATITWVIEWMQCIPQDGQLTDVVITAGWRCNGVQNANSTDYYGTACGTCSFPQPTEGGQFTPYADLTEQQVLSWCWANGIDKSAVEANVQLSINNQINPPVVTPPLPWVTPAA